jgi:GT2 family glycosyltransferase
LDATPVTSPHHATSAVRVSAIVPTIGRPDSLLRLLESLCRQTQLPDEVVIADGSGVETTRELAELPSWADAGLRVRHITVLPPNAVRQRTAAVAVSSADVLLFLDDDVVLEPDCVTQLTKEMAASSDVVAVVATFNNQTWPEPTTLWRWYLRIFHRMGPGDWHGKVVGPLLRFGFPPTHVAPATMEWVGGCGTLVRRSSFEQVGGFSDFFLHRCTMNEDVDLGLKLGKVGRILFCPSARLAHYHAPSGRVSVSDAAEDDVHNRFLIMNVTAGRSVAASMMLCGLFVLVESFSSLFVALRGRNVGLAGKLLKGRLRGFVRVVQYWMRNSGPASVTPERDGRPR